MISPPDAPGVPASVACVAVSALCVVAAGAFGSVGGGWSCAMAGDAAISAVKTVVDQSKEFTRRITEPPQATNGNSYDIVFMTCCRKVTRSIRATLMEVNHSAWPSRMLT